MASAYIKKLSIQMTQRHNSLHPERISKNTCFYVFCNNYNVFKYKNT